MVKIPALTHLSLRRSIVSAYLILFGGLATGLIIQTQALLAPASPSSTASHNQRHVRDGKTLQDFKALSLRVAELERLQTEHNLTVADPVKLVQKLADIHLDIQLGQTRYARSEIAALNQQLDQQFGQLNAAIASASAQQAATTVPTAASGRDIPILLYHHSPADFEAQMVHLEQAGYTTVDLTQVALGLTNRATLPAKPVVITLDDGFADQMGAAAILSAHHMKATFYIINGGEASQWCIGAGRRPSSCGDAYLTWDQVRSLDQNPLFTIGAHTVDHLDLAKQPEEVQRFEIVEGKHQLEAQLGHAIYHFCYPYGSFNDRALQIVREAGFVTATTTVPGVYQTGNGLFTLKRVRNGFDLK